KERVSLEVACLQQAQGAAQQFRCAMGPTDGCTGDDPPVEPGSDCSQELMHPDDRCFVNFVEVESVAEEAGARAKFGWQRILCPVGIKGISRCKPKCRREQTRGSGDR